MTMTDNCKDGCNIDIPIGEVHHLWWNFDRWCEKTYGKDYLSKLEGMDCINQIRKFTSRYYKENKPKERLIKIVKVDDKDYNNKSILVFIPHPTMGVTVIFVPEKAEHKNIFFLYPNRIKEIIKTLIYLQNSI